MHATMRVNAREVVGEIESSEGPGACVTLPSERYRGGANLTPPSRDSSAPPSKTPKKQDMDRQSIAWGRKLERDLPKKTSEAMA